jgi:hypothetical protein
MKYSKLFFLQILSIFGLLIGRVLSPENPIYPFMPTEDAMAEIKSIEIQTVITLAICSVAFTIIGRKFLNVSYLSVLVVTLLSGMLCVGFSFLRFG